MKYQDLKKQACENGCASIPVIPHTPRTKLLLHRDAHFDKALEALKEAVNHLEYCGYGDTWERECAGDMPERMQKLISELEEVK